MLHSAMISIFTVLNIKEKKRLFILNSRNHTNMSLADVIFRTNIQDLTHFDFRYPILSDSDNWNKTRCLTLFLITEIITARDDSESNNGLGINCSV